MVTRSLLAVVVGAAGMVVGPGLVTAAAEESPAPWTPYSSSDWTVAAGERCDFALEGDVLSDKERYRTTERFPDGSPRVQEFTGQLVMEFTNLETGESVVRNLTGRGDFEYFADGSMTLTAVGGHFAAGIGPGGDPARGFYVVTGSKHQLRIDPDGHRTLVPGDGPVENICDTLG